MEVSRQAEKENDRQYRVMDQMITMHSVLRDRYRRRAVILHCVLLAVSIVLCACVFVGDEILLALRLKPDTARIGIGVAAVVVLLISIIQLRVDWQRRSQSHADAVERLSRLKSAYRESRTQGQRTPQEFSALSKEWSMTMEYLPPIPEHQFCQLKAKHLFKIRLSQRISENPEVPFILLRARLRWEGFRNEVKDKKVHNK